MLVYIVPSFKKGNRDKSVNWRPVSLGSVVQQRDLGDVSA